MPATVSAAPAPEDGIPSELWVAILPLHQRLGAKKVGPCAFNDVYYLVRSSACLQERAIHLTQRSAMGLVPARPALKTWK
jgi:hypothetical protein